MFLLYAQHLHYVLHILFKGGISANMSVEKVIAYEADEHIVILTCDNRHAVNTI